MSLNDLQLFIGVNGSTLYWNAHDQLPRIILNYESLLNDLSRVSKCVKMKPLQSDWVQNQNSQATALVRLHLVVPLHMLTDSPELIVYLNFALVQYPSITCSIWASSVKLLSPETNKVSVEWLADSTELLKAQLVKWLLAVLLPLYPCT